MTTLNFNDIEWEVLDTLVAKRFAKFFKEHESSSKEIFSGTVQSSVVVNEPLNTADSQSYAVEVISTSYVVEDWRPLKLI